MTSRRTKSTPIAQKREDEIYKKLNKNELTVDALTVDDVAVRCGSTAVAQNRDKLGSRRSVLVERNARQQEMTTSQQY